MAEKEPTPEELEELLKKEARKDKLHQNYLKRKSNRKQKKYEEHTKAKKKAQIDRESTIHIGAVANALEYKSIQTERCNINRIIIKNNMLLEQAKEMLMLAKLELHSAQYAAYKIP